MQTLRVSKAFLICASVVYTAIFVMYGVIMFFVFRDSTLQLTQGGVFGDMFGTFNSFFTGLAFLAVSLTIYLQIQESNQSKHDAHISQVENTFFNMLTVLNQIIDFAKQDVRVRTGSASKSGREYFQYAFADLGRAFEKEVRGKTFELFGEKFAETLKSREDLDAMIANYQLDLYKVKPSLEKMFESFYTRHEAILGHYFRYVYNIIKYVKRSFIDEASLQQKYVDLLQAQMSNDEMGLLFYNALSIHGRNSEGKAQFQVWLDDHHFFENIGRRCVFAEDFTKFYPKTKFKFLLQEDRT